jgi:hypothetical protein
LPLARPLRFVFLLETRPNEEWDSPPFAHGLDEFGDTVVLE